jgi:Domain of Unknown Function (DUF349)
MPHLRLNRSAGARQASRYLGVSQRSEGSGSDRFRRAGRQKKALIREAKGLARSTDWRAGGEQLARLFRRWKAVGWAGPDDDERLWKHFKAAADEFHRRRSEHFAELDRVRKGKAVAKEQLIAEAQRLSSISDYGIAKGQFSDVMSRWRELGHVGNRENELWEQFVAARQAMYDATAEDRRAQQSEYVQRVEERIRGHREMIGKLKAQRRELAIRRRGIMPGWIGLEMSEEFDEGIGNIDQYLLERETWLEEDIQRVARAMAGQDQVSVAEFYRRMKIRSE